MVQNGMNFAAWYQAEAQAPPVAARCSGHSGRGTNYAPVASNGQARPWRRRVGMIEGWVRRDRLSKTARRGRYFAQSASKLVGRAGAIGKGKAARCSWHDA